MSREDTAATSLLKLSVIGDGACGKTSLVNHLVHGHCPREYNQTLGIEFYLRSITLQGGRQVTVQVWDVGGQTLGGNMLDKYLTGADGILLTYDITNESSFDNLEDWLVVARRSSSTPPRLALVANKCDLEHLRLVGREKHDRFAQAHGLLSYSVSAKTGEAVNTCFRSIVADILGVGGDDGNFVQKVLVAEIVRGDRRPPSSVNAPAATSAVCDLQ